MTEREAEYLHFLESKAVIAQQRGLPDPGPMNPNLKPHAAEIAAWMIRGGARACFAAFGLHKTSIQLQILDSILTAFPEDTRAYFKESSCGLIVCPLGVKHEFVREAKARKFNYTPIYVRTNAELEEMRIKGHRHFLTNYERVRDGDIDPNRFKVVSLDEAAVLRSFGSKTYQTFLTLFDKVPFKFVATATPDPNRVKELIHYAGFLGIMDTGQALTRFFKRDPTQAGNLQLHPHKEEEFWLWVSTWAVFIEKPSDLKHSDLGYDLPKLNIHQHRLPVDHASAGFDSWGQGRLLREATVSMSAAAREKRDSLVARVQEASNIIDAGATENCAKRAKAKSKRVPLKRWLIWHDLEDERRAIEAMFPEASTVYGNQSPDEKERLLVEFSEGELPILATKPSIAGSGNNFQRHCYSEIFLGIGFKFHDFIQAVHRVWRFGQTHEVDLHLIYTESEDRIFDALMAKWERHKKQIHQMSELVRKYGLADGPKEKQMQRAIASSRAVETGERFTLVNADNVMETIFPAPGLQRIAGTASETRGMAATSVDLIVTSVPFSDHYEYTELYNDFGHNNGDEGFFEQMDFLTPELKRILKPGRMYCVHAKDRLVYGSVSGDGMYTVNPFSDKCVAHLLKHGFRYCGRITIVTDVVRENNQTYRLGWSENEKDGTKMGVGSPEYVLLFRKLPSDLKNAYADVPVTHAKPMCLETVNSGPDDPYDSQLNGEMTIQVPFKTGLPIIPGTGYSRSRWQFDASPFWRSNGNRFLKPEEITQLTQETVRRLWHKFNETHIYDFEEHVAIAEQLEKAGCLPASFMLLDPKSHSPWVWDDVVRMRTLNTEQSRKAQEQHICPLQFDIVERLIERYSNPGELVLDPFAGLGTVPFLAIRSGRRGYGIELNTAYWVDSIGYCRAEEQKVLSPTLFDSLVASGEENGEPSGALAELGK